MAADRLKQLREHTRYDPAEVEPRVFERWEAAGIFHPEPEGTAEENFSIAVPPPNVTGVLHMGHALNGSIQDVAIRMARMRGRNTKWIYGTDHAGIGTEVKVVEALAEEGKTKEEIGREAFTTRVWEWRAQDAAADPRPDKRPGAARRVRDERVPTCEDDPRAAARGVVAR